jgi:hypothetical protein
MGLYINSNSKGEPAPYSGKADFLIADGATEVTLPHFRENLVCVVENPRSFDAALYCETNQDFQATRHVEDKRHKRYLIYEHARKLAGR